MAKVKGPLFSLGARGQLGKTLVYFPWKGINALRTYVIPFNPQSPAQDVQRLIFEAAVDEWHDMEPTADDVGAWNRYAGILAKIMSGFNAFMQTYINEGKVTNVWTRISKGQLYNETTTEMNFDVGKVSGGLTPIAHWGTSKTHFPNSHGMEDQGDGYWRYILPNLTTNKLYYAYADVGVSGATYGRTGIYSRRTA